MTKLREDLEAVVAGIRSGDAGVKYIATSFVIDNAAEILAMVEDTERWRGRFTELLAEALHARLSLAHAAEKSSIYSGAEKRLGEAIDRARKGKS